MLDVEVLRRSQRLVDLGLRFAGLIALERDAILRDQELATLDARRAAAMTVVRERYPNAGTDRGLRDRIMAEQSAATYRARRAAAQEEAIDRAVRGWELAVNRPSTRALEDLMPFADEAIALLEGLGNRKADVVRDAVARRRRARQEGAA